MTTQHFLRQCAAAGIAAMCTSLAIAADPALTVVEFYNKNLNHYFVTADPAEQAGIDKGAAGPGWVRTGQVFLADALEAQTGAKKVCRFYSASQNSHFYTADAEECAFVKKSDPGWQYEGLVFAIAVPSASGCASGTQAVYRVYNNGFGKPVGSNHRYMADLTLAQQQAKGGQAFEGTAFCAPLSSAAKRADAVRLLKQASFGPTFPETARVAQMGAEACLEEQFVQSPSRYTASAWVPSTKPTTCINDTTPPLRADSYCQRDNYSNFVPQREFWQHALSNPDQLRQRVAWAWSQFFVISALEISLPYGMLDYQQMLRDNAFENFGTLLKKVTLHSAMGEYLDMANNQKPDVARGTTPNENYAREVLQLFSIGLNELNLDGTAKLDAAGRTIPTYDNEEIEGYAYTFTGWTYPTIPGQAPTPTKLNGRNWAGTMEIREYAHDLSVKELLDGVKSKPNVATAQDLDGALSTIFAHRNVPPFVSKFMIQKLVTGDPSPQYVERVARVFLDNGRGTRGDMRAVVRAILLDPEARGPEKFDSRYGQLTEPVLYVANIARALNAKTDGVYFRSTTGSMGQNVFSPPTVFNYYPPDHTLVGNGVTAQEFALLNTSTTFSRINFADQMLMGVGTKVAPDATVFGAIGTEFDWSPFTAVAADPEALMNKVAEVLTGVPFSSAMKAAIRPAIEALAATDTLGRAKTAMYLAVVSPTTQVKR